MCVARERVEGVPELVASSDGPQIVRLTCFQFRSRSGSQKDRQNVCVGTVG